MVTNLSAIKKRSAGLTDYLAIARLDHSAKHIFIVPGILFSYLLRGVHNEDFALQIVLGLMSAICIASGNYVINEWLDRDFDRHHPEKSRRSAVQAELLGRWVVVEWLCFVGVGLGCAALCSKTMLIVVGLFAIQGLVYNVPPLRAKEIAYLDVISESINNPLRLMIGWAMVDSTTMPPSSIILAYWLGGAFLMATKRLSEYLEIVDDRSKELLVRYRASFASYSDISLTVSCFVYAMLSSFFLAIFFLKYRIEYILIMPFIVGLFGQYLALSMRPGSSAQKPEKLYRERGLIALILVIAGVFAFATFVQMPVLDALTGQRYINLE